MVVKKYVERIKEANSHLNAVVDNRFGKAIIEATICDEQLKTGKFDIKTLEREKPLFGVPITIKESCAVKGNLYFYENISIIQIQNGLLLKNVIKR